MRRAGATSSRLGRAAAALVVAGAAGVAGVAGAEGLSLRVEPSYAGTTTFTSDASGRHEVVEQRSVDQRYRLTLDRQLYPNLRLSGGGLYDWALGEGRTPLGPTDSDRRSWSGFARLALTGDVLTGGAAYDRREESTDLRVVGASLDAPSLVRESFSLAAIWKPEGMPSANLRLGRAHTFDRSGTQTDLTQDEAVLIVGHRPRGVDLQYVARWAHPQDALGGTERQELDQTGRAAYGRGFLGDRGTLYLGYSLRHHLASTTATGRGGEVATQQFPSGGLSLVEPPAGFPERATLDPNPALVDGEAGASAGLDVGTSASGPGDGRKRDVGLTFANPQTEVNELRVSVDTPLPAGIWERLSWAVYQSDDNLTWIPVASEGPARFDPFLNRFELRIRPTRARHLKAVTAPLLAAVTSDARFASIRVTEVQAFLVVPAEQASGTTSFVAGNFNGSARYLLARRLGLAYDLALQGGHDPAGASGSLVNGVSLAQRLNRMTALSARLDRTDSEDAGGHVGQFRLTSTLAVDPLSSVGAALTYSGQATQRGAGWSTVNALTLVNRLDPYRGVSFAANATVSLLLPERGGRTVSRLAGASLSLAPHPKVAFTGSYAYALTDVESAAAPALRSEQQRVEGTVSVSPIPALFGSASVARVLAGAAPATLANVALNVSPFPGGDLLVRLQYNETLDGGADQRLRLVGPALRWNVRRGAWLDLSYTYSETRSPVLDTSSRALFASFVATLG